MQEKDSNPRPPAYEAGELATALSCNVVPGCPESGKTSGRFLKHGRCYNKITNV